MNPALWSTKKAAAYLGMSAQALKDWRGQKKGPRFLKFGYRVFYTQAQLDEFIKNSEVSWDQQKAG